MDEHLGSFAPAPGEETQKVFFTDVLGSRGRVDPPLASLDHAGQVAHDGIS